MSETIKRIFRFGVQNYIRNGWLSMAATLVLALTLFIVSVFALQTYVIKATTRTVENKLDMAIYIKDSPSEEEVAGFITQIKAMSDVKELIYLNKEQVIEEWNKLHVDEKIKSQVSAENNPLPRTIKLKATDPAQLDGIYEGIKASAFYPNIRSVSYGNNRQIIQQLVARSRQTQRNGIIISSIFVLISIIFVYNTIRLIIRFRQDEIGIMKLVGATDSFIRGPFVVEGALYGIAAGLLTLLALFFYLKNGLSESTTLVASSDTLISGNLYQFYLSHLPLFAASMISSAVVVAVICSSISVHYHLKR